MDSGNSLLLVLLDLTAAFEALDHNVLISRAVSGHWLSSDRSFCVMIDDFTSASAAHPRGVP